MFAIPNKKLRVAIAINGLNQRQFALSIGVSEAYLSSMLNGYESPSQKFIRKSCFILGQNPEELFPGYENVN